MVPFNTTSNFCQEKKELPQACLSTSGRMRRSRREVLQELCPTNIPESPAQLETESLIFAPLSVQGPRISRKCAHFAVSRALAGVKSGVKNVPDPPQWVRAAVLLVLLLPGAGHSGVSSWLLPQTLVQASISQLWDSTPFPSTNELCHAVAVLISPRAGILQAQCAAPAPGQLPSAPRAISSQVCPPWEARCAPGSHREHPLPPVFAQLVATGSSAQLWMEQGCQLSSLTRSVKDSAVPLPGTVKPSLSPWGCPQCPPLPMESVSGAGRWMITPQLCGTYLKSHCVYCSANAQQSFCTAKPTKACSQSSVSSAHFYFL